jgi:hypothetical protein
MYSHDIEQAGILLSVYVGSWTVAAIDDCLVTGQFAESQQPRQAAGQWFWLFQNALSGPALGLGDRALGSGT